MVLVVWDPLHGPQELSPAEARMKEALEDAGLRVAAIEKVPPGSIPGAGPEALEAPFSLRRLGHIASRYRDVDAYWADVDVADTRTGRVYARGTVQYRIVQ